jgi:hypothetical protein
LVVFFLPAAAREEDKEEEEAVASMSVSQERRSFFSPRWVPQVVFKGPVHRTEKKTETGLNWTD